jgi:probable addiction module antidote protein
MSERVIASIVGDPVQASSFFFVEETSPAKQRISNAQGLLGNLEERIEMTNRKSGISYNKWEIDKLRSDPELAVEYLKVSMESLSNPEERAGALLSLRAVAEACGGLGAVAAQAGISRESLYRSLSAKGNPTLKTLVAVLNTLGLRLSVESNKSDAA